MNFPGRLAHLMRAHVAPLLFSAAVVGCGSSKIPRPPFAPQPTGALVAVPHEPPPARVEHAPARPSTPGVVWVDGEWSWRTRRWWWTPGRWLVPPVGAKYSPWCTVRAPDGVLYFAPAMWRDASGREVGEPRAVAVAVVDSGAVVDPAGNMERTMVTTPK